MEPDPLRYLNSAAEAFLEVTDASLVLLLRS